MATWTLAGGVVRLAPFADLDDADVDGLATEAVDVCRFLGLTGAANPLIVTTPRGR